MGVTAATQGPVKKGLMMLAKKFRAFMKAEGEDITEAEAMNQARQMSSGSLTEMYRGRNRYKKGDVADTKIMDAGEETRKLDVSEQEQLVDTPPIHALEAEGVAGIATAGDRVSKKAVAGTAAGGTGAGLALGAATDDEEEELADVPQELDEPDTGEAARLAEAEKAGALDDIEEPEEDDPKGDPESPEVLALKRIVEGYEKRLAGAPSERDVQKALEQYRKAGTNLPKAKRTDWNSKLADIEAQYEAAEDRVAWAEFAATIGKALANMAAGWYGMKTGLNMGGGDYSGVQFDAIHNRNLKKLERKTGLVGEERKLEERQIERDETARRRAAERTADAMLKEVLQRRSIASQERMAKEKTEAALAVAQEKAATKAGTKSHKELKKEFESLDKAILANMQEKEASGKSAKSLRKDVQKYLLASGQPPQAIENFFKKKASLWGIIDYETTKDPEEREAALNELRTIMKAALDAKQQ